MVNLTEPTNILPPIFQEKVAVDSEKNRDLKAERFASLSPDKTSQEFKADMSSGYEERHRELLAQQASIREEETRVGIIDEVSQNPTAEDVELVRGLTSTQVNSPHIDTILETEYAKKHLSELNTSLDEDILNNALSENENASHDVMDFSEKSASRVLIAQNIAEGINARLSEEGLLHKGQAFLETMVPFKSAYNVHDIFRSAESLIPGNNKEEQIAYLYTLEPEEFQSTLKDAVETLYETNSLDASIFVQEVMSYSAGTKFMDNAFGVVDVASLIPITAVGRFAKASLTGTKTVLNNPKQAAKTLAQIGDNTTAAIARVADDIKSGSLLKATGKKIEDAMPTIMSPGKVFDKSNVFDSQSLDKLRTSIVQNTDLMARIINHTNLVERLDDNQLLKALADESDNIIDMFPNTRNSVIDVSTVDELAQTAADSGTNTYTVSVKFGKTDGSLFSSEASARNFVTKKIKPKTDSYEIKSQGGGYYVEIKKNVDETSSSLRDLTIQTESISPANGGFKAYLRSADGIVSKENARARAVAVQGQEFLSDMVSAMAKPIQSLGKTQKKEMNQIWEMNRDFKNGKDAPGMFYKTVEEFETEFVSKFGKKPSIEQADSYFNYVQLNDLDYAIRDMSLYTQKARKGIENISFSAGDELIEMEGKVLSDLPWESKTPFRIKVVQGDKMTKKASQFTAKKSMDTLIQSGYKVIQSTDGVYHVVKGFKRNPIELGKLNYRAGGHRVYKHPFYVKQGSFSESTGTKFYKGDLSLANATTAKEANEIAGLMDQARLMAKAKDPSLKQFMDDNLSWMSHKRFMKNIKDGVINLNVPIKGVRSGQRSLDVLDHKVLGDFVDTGRSEHNLLGNLQGKFLGERDAQAIDTITEEGATLFRMDEDKFLAPLDTLTQSTSNMLKTRVMQDYQTKSAQDFVREFSDVLDYGSINELDYNPYEYLYSGKYKSGADPERVQNAENVRKTVLNLNNFQTLPEKRFAQKKEAVLATINSKLGPSVGPLVSEKVLPSILNVDQAMRSVAFQTKMGLFNVRQLPLQASAVALAVAISPKSGIKAMRALPMYAAMTKMNPAIRAQAFRKLSLGSGWKETEFLDAMHLFKKSGFAKVGNDVAYMDQFKTPNLFSGASAQASKVLNTGTVFFNAGEVSARQVAFFTAYDEFSRGILRGATGKTINRRVEQRILMRAQDLTANMTRNSNAQWQKGYAAIVTQFYSWNMRLAEQMLTSGSNAKLTGAEKGRLFAGVSMLYGLPVGASMVLPIPFREMLREGIIESGQDPDDQWYEPLIDGVLPSMVEWMSGSDLDISAGFGPAGFSTIWDYYKGDAELSELMLGASGSIISDIVMDSEPMWKGIRHAIDFDDGTTYPILAEDLVKPFRNISTVNNVIALYQATNIRQWISKNGTTISDMTPFEGLTKYVTGISPQEVSDTFNRIGAMKQIKEHQESVMKDITSIYRKGMDNDDASIRRRLMSEAKGLGLANGLTYKQMTTSIRRALKSGVLSDEIMKRYEIDYQRQLKLKDRK